MKRALKLTFIATVLCCTTAFAATDAKAVFAAGCFWCTQADFNKVPGVIKTYAGFIGGTKPNPTYAEVSSGTTHYTEAVQVIYNPAKVSYQQLLGVYWKNVDYTRNDGQFCDNGPQYRPGIFYYTSEQQKLAEQSKQALTQSGKGPIKVEITQAGTFYPAEAYHQNYYKKHPLRYKFYRYHCGRDQRLQQLNAQQQVSLDQNEMVIITAIEVYNRAKGWAL